MGWALWEGTELIDAGQTPRVEFIDAVWAGDFDGGPSRTSPAIKPTSEDWAYLAGLIDGEGHITRKVTASKGVVSLRVKMNDLAPLEWGQSRFGGSITGPTARPDPKHAPYYTWVVAKQADVLYLLSHVRPLLRVRHQQADEGLRALHRVKTIGALLKPVELLVVEEFRLYPWVLQEGGLDFDEVRTARAIGALEFIARAKNMDLILQPATVKEPSMEAGARELFQTPLHENRHANDAILHGWYHVATTVLGRTIQLPHAKVVAVDPSKLVAPAGEGA